MADTKSTPAKPAKVKIRWVSDTIGHKGGSESQVDAAVAKGLISNGHAAKAD